MAAMGIRHLIYLSLMFRIFNTVDGKKYTIKNPLVILNKKGVIKLTDGTVIPFNEKNKKDIINFVTFLISTGTHIGEGDENWQYDADREIIKIPGRIYYSIEGFDPGIMAETFLYKIHHVDGIKDKIVVQAGGFTGDTALYYASLGARVYSFEPDPNSYRIALRNIELNPRLAPLITMVNAAIGEDGWVDFPISESPNGGASIFLNKKGKTVRVRSMSISTILSEYKIDSPYLLDLDIKGAEFLVINDEAIKRFERVRIEYSPYLIRNKIKNATLEYLKDKLVEYGFRNIRVFKHNCGRYDLADHGTIEASK